MRLKKTGESWMKAYRIHSGRKQDALELIGHVVSNPTARGVRVRVRAVAAATTSDSRSRARSTIGAVISSAMLIEVSWPYPAGYRFDQSWYAEDGKCKAAADKANTADKS
jgi:hypothetical protein